MRKHSLDKLMNRLSLLLLLGTAVFLAAYWRRIPEEVPMHFNAAGEINRWGSKWWLLMLPVITWLVYGFLTVAEQIFGICGNGAKGPEKTGSRPLSCSAIFSVRRSCCSQPCLPGLLFGAPWLSPCRRGFHRQHWRWCLGT